MNQRLYEVRCPGKVLNKTTGELITCNKLCVKVCPGSSGEIQCRHCKMRFAFYVDSQANSTLWVRTKALEKDVVAPNVRGTKTADKSPQPTNDKS